MNRKELLLISVGIFMTVIAWLMADVYHAATVEKVKNKINPPVLTEYEVNKEILNQLQQKTE